MNSWTAFRGILAKDMRAYYLKPPNISWGLIFPIAWTLMFFVRSGSPVELTDVLPGVVVLSILFGTTSMLAVTITFERRSRSFERLLLAPISLSLLIGAKTAGAIVFGVINALIPMIWASFLLDLSGTNWALLLVGVTLTAIASTFLGLFVAVSVREVFEAQTFSNFFRFPMLFLSGLFIPVAALPFYLRPISYILPPTYGTDIIRMATTGRAVMPLGLSLPVLMVLIVLLFLGSMSNVKKKWIL